MIVALSIGFKSLVTNDLSIDKMDFGSVDMGNLSIHDEVFVYICLYWHVCL